MTETRTVCLKGKLHEWGASLQYAPASVVYVGRRQTMGGWRLNPSPFANPFTAQKVGGAGTAVGLYAEWFAGRPNLIAAAEAMLRGKTLACWCDKPGQPCHAGWLADWLDGYVALPEAAVLP